MMMKSSANQQKKKGTAFLTSVVLLTLLYLSRPALSQVSIIGDWQTGTSHTKEAGTDRALIFIAHEESSSGTPTVTSVTYGGQTMNKIIEITSDTSGSNYRNYVAAFILNEAGIDAATNADFSVTWSDSTSSISYASVFLGSVDQTDPIGDSDSAQTGSGTNPISTSALATSDGDMVIDAATCGNVGSYTLTGFTEGYDQQFGSSTGGTGAAGYVSATGTNVTPTADYSASVNRQVLIGFVVQAAPLDPNKATNPNPGNGEDNVSVSTGLSWDAPAAYTPTSYDVYFGTNPTAHSNPKNTVYTNGYDPPGDLAEGTTYYWAVDSNDNGTIYTGETWSFTTEGGYCGDGTCDPDENCWTCEADCGACVDDPIWEVDARCFLDGPSGEFDDIAVKDPSIVYSGGKWHLFYTGRDVGVDGNFRMGYASATTIPGLNSATRYYLSSLDGGSYFCAPQVFWFEEKGKWYLIYQSGLGPTFSTNTDISDPDGWAAGTSMGFSGGVVDYWCISDGDNVYIFYSPMDDSYTILRRSTTVADFPYNWSAADVVATDTFEAPHVYKNLADGKYYMMVENLYRYFELWTADNPGGTWTKLQEYWAHRDQLIDNADHWTDQVSHGEIIRAGVDEKLEINSINFCEILIQGVVDGDYGDYGNIPYDLGIIRRQSPDTTPPSAPTGLVATAGDSLVSLDWDDNSEEDLNGYNVYRSTTSGSGYSQINGSLLSSSDYIDGSATPGTTYYYVVTAVDLLSNESGYSNEASATPYDVTPAAPTGLLGTAGNGIVWLNWNDNSEVDIDGYNVYRSTTQGSGYSQINGPLVSSSNYTDAGVTNDTTYYYVVTAVDEGSNESGYSSEVEATPTGSGPIIYNFEGITASDPDYNAYACDVDVFPFYDDAENRNSMVEATDQQYVNISADNTAEWTIPTPYVGDELFVWIEMKINVPPDDISKIDLTFNGNTGDSGSITHAIYVMIAGADWKANSSWVQVGSDESIPGGVDTAMTRLITSDIGTYIDGTGKIVWGVHETADNEAMHINYLEAAVYGPSVDGPPAAPTALEATAGNETVSLDWDDNSETDLAGYNVYRSMSQGGDYDQINISLVADSDYVDNDANNFTPYYYVVTAVDANDHESGYSNEDSATPDYQTCQDVQDANEGLLSDLGGDCYVDLWDAGIMANYWLYTNCGDFNDCEGADFIPTDGDVDFEDFSDFAVDWMLCNKPGDPNCIKNWWP